MDALLSTLLSVFLAEMGDRTQILAAALALRYHKNGAVLAGLSCATLLNCTISAAGGSVIDGWISERPVKLFAGMAYIFAGLGMLMWRRKVDPLSNWKTPAFLTAFLGLFILEFGDKSQFLIAAQAARTPLWGMALAGGFLGIMAATIPAVILRERLAHIVPLKPIRWVSGALLLGWGIWLALQAFDIA
ncbi:MAG: TMEM165/GDT1 family protein [Sphingomonadaceae bacterium]|nr:TMEM165/GDT1 family protein [Sphingomonadaceae bacterium]